jgi:hypothetical protein
VGALSAAIFVILNVIRGEYSLPNFFAFKPQLRRTIKLWNVTFICLLAIGFLAQTTVVYSRGWIVVFYASTACVLLALRCLFVQATIRGSQAGLISAQRIYLVGTGKHVGDFIARYQPQRLGVNVVGCHFLTPVEPEAPGQVLREVFAGDIDAAINGARSVEPDAIYLVMPWSATDAISRCAESFLTLPVEIHLGPEQVLDRFENIQLSKFGPLASLQLTRMPLSRLERFEKRAFDLVVAGVALLLLTPVLVLVAIMIKLDSAGPVLFLQHRYGFNQKPFRIIKFRTMRTLDDGPFILQAKRDDPRVTKLGSWLRRWNIDEFPNSSTFSRATCRWSDRVRMRSRTIANTSSASRSMRVGTTSSRVLPVGRKSTASAARPIATARCRGGSSTISITSTTGRSGSIFKF